MLRFEKSISDIRERTYRRIIMEAWGRKKWPILKIWHYLPKARDKYDELKYIWLEIKYLPPLLSFPMEKLTLWMPKDMELRITIKKFHVKLIKIFLCVSSQLNGVDMHINIS